MKSFGLQKGEKIGLEKGRRQGEEQKKIEIAKKLLALGISLEDIQKATGLTKKEIENLK